ncbi:MAG: co-chaperone GroES [Armatimonadetes bacterium]|nr:co-chaperone GroES [Armatimonadota bacterium]MDW8029458.1 co-chaperone GroES [Armatimonadota bacterium]
MATVIKPLADKVLVKVVEEEEKTPGGIYLPDTAKEKPFKGKVISVGTGKQLKDGRILPFEELGVKPGDTVIFSKYAGTEIKLDGEKHILLSVDDIYAVIEE